MDKRPGTDPSHPDIQSTPPLPDQSSATPSFAKQHSNKDFTVIENDGTGDNWQMMVSTNDQIIHGSNKGRGWRNRQLGGHVSEESVQKISADMVKIGSQPREDYSQSTDEHEPGSRPDREDHDGAVEFNDRHGPGLSLNMNSPGRTGGSI